MSEWVVMVGRIYPAPQRWNKRTKQLEKNYAIYPIGTGEAEEIPEIAPGLERQRAKEKVPARMDAEMAGGRGESRRRATKSQTSKVSAQSKVSAEQATKEFLALTEGL